MSNTIKRKNISLLFLLLIFVFILIFSDFGKSKTIIVYDCDKLFLYKDVPFEVMEQCSKLVNQKRLTVNLNNAIII